MSVEQQANRSKAQDVLISVLSQGGDSNAIAEDLFGVADLLGSRGDLTGALIDPARTAADKQRLAADLLADRLQPQTMKVVDTLVSLHWREAGTLLETLEELAAQAVLEQAYEQDQLWQVEQELQMVYELFRSSRDLRTLMASSFVGAPGDHAKFVADLLADKVLPVTLRLVGRAVYRARSGRVLSILSGYQYEAVHLRGQYLYSVTSAQELTDEQYTRLHDLIQRKMKKPILLTRRVDPNLIGGFRVMSANHVVDASVSADLVQLRKTLKR